MGTDLQPVRRSATKAKARILVVDDEPSARFAVGDFLESHGFEVDIVSNAQMVFRIRRPHAVILDYLLAEANTVELLARFKATDANVPVLILTAHGSIDLAVQLIKAGADQFMTKPTDLPSMLVLLRREIEKYNLRRSNTN
jgi:DNA-binding NtrC family response regulator